MPVIHVYIAQSLDGYIARPDGGIDWLRPFDGIACGYAAFIREIATIVMGRKSYDLARSFGDWPYPTVRSLVITSRPRASPTSPPTSRGSRPHCTPPAAPKPTLKLVSAQTYDKGLARQSYVRA